MKPVHIQHDEGMIMTIFMSRYHVVEVYFGVLFLWASIYEHPGFMHYFMQQYLVELIISLQYLPVQQRLYDYLCSSICDTDL